MAKTITKLQKLQQKSTELWSLYKLSNSPYIFEKWVETTQKIDKLKRPGKQLAI